MKDINTLKHIENKVIISGNVLETFTFEHGYSRGLQGRNNSGRFSNSTTSEEKKYNREKVLNRARARVRRLANANPQLNKFLTLTFKDNITDLKVANKLFKNFILRLNYYCKKQGASKFEYIAVVEFQKRGAVHYHLLCNLPYVQADIIETIWGNGFIYINKIDNVDNVGAYITKYMTKKSQDKRLIENRSYFTSQGLNEPKIMENCEDISFLLKNKKVVREYQSTFENGYSGKVSYTQFVLADSDSLFNPQIVFERELHKQINSHLL